MNCSSCGKEITKEEAYHIRREWKKRGLTFCDECVTTLKAKWFALREATK